MINKTLLLTLIIFITMTSAAFAAGDPMKSLFLFQKQMADKGNSSAMMKMGVMYERGEGVDISFANALKMYEKANQAGNPKAQVAIQRLKNIKNKSDNKQKLKAQKKQRALNAAKLKKQRQAAAQKKAQEAANNKALREKLNKEKAAKAKAAAKAKSARDAKAKAKAEQKAKAKAARDARAQAKIQAAKDAKAARLAAKKKKESKGKKEGFKSDPCKGKAARLLSICR